jgi:hypothetical protein
MIDISQELVVEAAVQHNMERFLAARFKERRRGKVVAEGWATVGERSLNHCTINH